MGVKEEKCFFAEGSFTLAFQSPWATLLHHAFDYLSRHRVWLS